MNRKYKYKADKISGIAGTVYLLSVVLEAVKKTKEGCPYIFPFYALTMKLSDKRADEWIIDEEFERVSGRIFGDVKERGLGFVEEIKDRIVLGSEELHDRSKKAYRRMPEWDNDKLVEEYRKFIDIYTGFYGLGALTFLYEHILSDRLSKSLARKNKNVTEVVGKLLKTKYRSFMMEAETKLEEIREAEDIDRKRDLAEEFIGTFFYIKTSYLEAPVLGVDAVVRMAEEQVEVKDNGEAVVGGKSDWRVDGNERLLINLLKVSEVMRDQRKRINLMGSFGMQRFLEEAAKRSGVSIDLAKNIFWYEYEELVGGSSELVDRLKKRKEVTMVYDEQGRDEYLEKVVVGERKQVDSGISEIEGTPAARGFVKGKVRIVLGPQDFKKVEKGDVLVAEMTRPDFVSIMRKAAAIVTDEGSLTSHAAVVSRELGVPCVVGTKVATRVLKDGDLVEVNADKGTVRKIDGIS